MAQIKQRGSLEQFMNVVRNRIEDLSGEPVESSFKYPEDMEDLENGEYESHVTEPVSASESVELAEDVDDDDEYDENAEYIQTLIGDLESEIVGRHGDVIESIVFDDDDETLYMTVTFEYNGETSINDYEIPFEDLSMDPESMEDDVNYIADQVDVDMSDLDD